MTADVVGAAHEECMAAGMNDFVCKPFAAELLFQTIARWTTAPSAVGARSKESASVGKKALPAALPGIDVAEGLRYLGGVEAHYRKLLHRFRLDHGQADRKIARHLAAGMRVDAEREAHSVKGLAGQMGAHELCACAARLESVLRRDGTEATFALTTFAHALKLVTDGLVALDTEPSLAIRPSLVVPSIATVSQLLPLTERLSRLLELNDPDAQSSAVTLRDSLTGQGRVQADDLVRFLNDYDFEAARTALEEVVASLNFSSHEKPHDQHP
jgi:two-component system sensor histidine kinase/response regulator